jgi:outer membrane protein assembly factor BamA
MSWSKAKVALAVLLTVTALGVGVGVSRHGAPGGGHGGTGLASMPGACGADGGKRLVGQAPAFERYYAGGFRSLRGFAFRGVPPKAGGAGGGCEEPAALDREPKDVRVVVQEQQSGSLLFGVGVSSDAGLVGSVVLNEKHFDTRRPPSRFDDPLRGRAWRGAGQELRVEAVPGTQLQRCSVSLREPLYPVAFLDSGTVERNVTPHDYRVSAGVGLRIKVPMLGPVPVALDFGFPQGKGQEGWQQLSGFWAGSLS